MAAPSGKRYGLILSSKKKPSGFSKPSVFGDDSSDEEVSASMHACCPCLAGSIDSPALVSSGAGREETS